MLFFVVVGDGTARLAYGGLHDDEAQQHNAVDVSHAAHLLLVGRGCRTAACGFVVRAGRLVLSAFIDSLVACLDCTKMCRTLSRNMWRRLGLANISMGTIFPIRALSYFRTLLHRI